MATNRLEQLRVNAAVWPTLAVNTTVINTAAAAAHGGKASLRNCFTRNTGRTGAPFVSSVANAPRRVVDLANRADVDRCGSGSAPGPPGQLTDRDHVLAERRISSEIPAERDRCRAVRVGQRLCGRFGLNDSSRTRLHWSSVRSSPTELDGTLHGVRRPTRRGQRERSRIHCQERSGACSTTDKHRSGRTAVARRRFPAATWSVLSSARPRRGAGPAADGHGRARTRATVHGWPPTTACPPLACVPGGTTPPPGPAWEDRRGVPYDLGLT